MEGDACSRHSSGEGGWRDALNTVLGEPQSAGSQSARAASSCFSCCGSDIYVCAGERRAAGVGSNYIVLPLF
jgi:hypothetical protein